MGGNKPGISAGIDPRSCRSHSRALPAPPSCATIPRGSQRSNLLEKPRFLFFLKSRTFPGTSLTAPGEKSGNSELQGGRLLPRCLPGDGFAGFWEAEPNLTPLSPPQVSASMEAAPAPKKKLGERKERSPNPPESAGDPKNFRNGLEGGAAGAALSRFGCCRRELGAGIYWGLAGKERSQFPGALPGASWSRTIKIPLG